MLTFASAIRERKKLKGKESKIENKTEGGSVAHWQMRQNRSDFTADPPSSSLYLRVCEMALWSSALFMVQTHKEDQRQMKNSGFRGVFSLWKMAASQTWAVMAFLLALGSLSWLLSPLHHCFGWWDEMERWLRGSTYTPCMGWRHATDPVLSADWNWTELSSWHLFLFSFSFDIFQSLSVLKLLFRYFNLEFSSLKSAEKCRLTQAYILFTKP